MNDVYGILSAAVPGSCGVVDPAPWALVRVVGPDAVEFLHRICSQDVEALTPGAVAPACFLTPKGKLVATGVLARTDEGVAIEVARALEPALAEYLERFHFTERLEIEREPVSTCAEVVGSAAFAAAGVDGPGWVARDGVVVLAGERAGVRWATAHGAAAGAWAASLGLEPLDAELAESLRLASGRLIVGVDTDDATIALEAPVDDHISTTKGCYTGQEIVARIHTYGHVNRKLVLVHAAGPLAPGSGLCDEDGDACGRLTSCATLPGDHGMLAWGYVPRELADRGTALRLEDGEPAQVVGFGPA